MAGGFKNFGPTYNSTGHVRLGYEGLLNGAHELSTALLNTAMETGDNLKLAGKFAAIGADGVVLANGTDKPAIGLFREDLNDMVNASEKATFYFRGGEYYVNAARAADVDFAVGEKLYADATGSLTNLVVGSVVGVCTHVGEYRAGNMFDKATKGVTDTDTFIGFIMFV